MTSHDDHLEGLAHDLPGLVERGLGRRGLLGLLGGVGAAALVACGPDDELTEAGTPSGQADGEIPEETAGPYPGDGSNGPDVLSESGVVRSNITRSFGTASGVAAGVPLTIRLRVLNAQGDQVTPYEGAAVYLWHCDAEGQYSMYSEAIAEENYLRGVQVADADGWLEFQSIFPGAYSGRWPHAHFEVYPSVEDATSASNRLRTSQLALPEDVCAQVYADADGYDQSAANLSRSSLDTDMVFADGYSLQLATVTGSVSDGFTSVLNVPV